MILLWRNGLQFCLCSLVTKIRNLPLTFCAILFVKFSSNVIQTKSPQVSSSELFFVQASSFHFYYTEKGRGSFVQNLNSVKMKKTTIFLQKTQDHYDLFRPLWSFKNCGPFHKTSTHLK